MGELCSSWGKLWALWGSVCCILWHLSFRKLGSPIRRFTHTLESPSFLDKTQVFSAKSRNLYRLCSDNHLKVKEIFSGCFWGKGNSKPARKSLGYGNSERQGLTTKTDVQCKLDTENPHLHTRLYSSAVNNVMEIICPFPRRTITWVKCEGSNSLKWSRSFSLF